MKRLGKLGNGAITTPGDILPVLFGERKSSSTAKFVCKALRLAKLVEQTSILDRNHRLLGKIFDLRSGCLNNLLRPSQRPRGLSHLFDDLIEALFAIAERLCAPRRHSVESRVHCLAANELVPQ
jgi:hypothetical protein